MSAELAVLQQVKRQTSRVPKSIVNAQSTTNLAAKLINAAVPLTVRPVLSGSCTAGVLKTILSVTGPGELNFFAVSSVDTTTRTHRVKITLDSTSVFDSTTQSTSTALTGLIAIGWASTSNLMPSFDKVDFNKSCLIEYATSVTETDKTNIYLDYKTY